MSTATLLAESRTREMRNTDWMQHAFTQARASVSQLELELKDSKVHTPTPTPTPTHTHTHTHTPRLLLRPHRAQRGTRSHLPHVPVHTAVD